MSAALAEWEASGEYVAYDGERIFVRRARPSLAPALLLIHGFPTASWDWHALWPALTARFQVLAPDMLGFGFSTKPRGYAYSIAGQATLLETLLRDASIEEYHILAHDYGDTVAQELLARQEQNGHKPRVRSVAFLNGGLFPETHRALLAQRLLLSPLGPWLTPLLKRNALARSMRRIFGPATPPDDATIDEFWLLIECNNGIAAMPRLIRYIHERRVQRERWVGALQRTRIPLKLIDGAADPISGAHMAQRYRELVPDADITLLPAIGHYPQIEAPAAVLAAYFDFLARRFAENFISRRHAG